MTWRVVGLTLKGAGCELPHYVSSETMSYSFEEALADAYGSNRLTAYARRYFVVSEEEYQSYWKDIVS